MNRVVRVSIGANDRVGSALDDLGDFPDRSPADMVGHVAGMLDVAVAWVEQPEDQPPAQCLADLRRDIGEAIRLLAVAAASMDRVAGELEKGGGA